MKIPSFRTLNKLEYAQAAIKYPRAVLQLACHNKAQAVEQDRQGLLRTLFGRKRWRSGRVTKHADEELRVAKCGTFNDLINSPKAFQAQTRVGEQWERLNVFQRRLESEILRK
jgi:hypothetical protein